MEVDNVKLREVIETLVLDKSDLANLKAEMKQKTKQLEQEKKFGKK